MTLTKSLLLGSAATLVALAGAHAADLPSQKAAPVSYVKICDAYGAGFFFIPGTDTCVKLGGYVRVEYQYTPAQDVYRLAPAVIAANEVGTGMRTGTGDIDARRRLTSTAAIATSGANDVNVQPKALQDETGFEVRGRIDVDARTPTTIGVARTFIRLRAANTSGIRNTTPVNVFGYANSTASTTSITIESAMVQWAGFTFGVAPENYAMMPSMMYHANPWAGFPNGMKQLAYTAQLGGGVSATLAIEDRTDHGSSIVVSRPDTAAAIVGNLRIDQPWGFAAVHALFQRNSAFSRNGVTWRTSTTSGMSFPTGAQGDNEDYLTRNGWAVGATFNFKLPMIAAGDQMWLTANYADGAFNTLLSAGGLSNVNTAANHRLMGGLVRVDQNLGYVDANTLDNVRGWNVAAAFTHYWTQNWRSNFTAGYVVVNPPTIRDAGIAWGRGQLQVYTASIVYSPVRNLDIGLEFQYANLKNRLQVINGVGNTTNTDIVTTIRNAGALHEDNWSTKLRVERTF
jgi:hypothetical protein